MTVFLFLNASKELRNLSEIMENLTAYLNRSISDILGTRILENVIVDSIIVTEADYDKFDKRGLLLEAKVQYNPVPDVKHYSYRIDKQLGEGGPGRQRHIHIYYKNNELFALNADSTAHDGYHKVKISDELSSFLNGRGFPVPPNNIIEFYQAKQDATLLCEGETVDVINDTSFKVCSAIRDAERITIIEANVCNSKLDGKYSHVNKLADIPQERLDEVKEILIDFLKTTGKYSDDKIEIFDSTYPQYKPHRLYIAWS